MARTLDVLNVPADVSQPAEHAGAMEQRTLAHGVRYATLREGLEELIETPPSLRCDAETIVFLQRVRSQIDYTLSTSGAEFEQWGEWARDGAKTATAWIDTTCHVPKNEARAELRRGRGLPALPLVAQAWKDGDIGAAHVDALLRVKRPVTEEALARDESTLVDAAKTMKFAEFSTVLDYWEQHADQDGTEEAAEAKRNQRDVYLVPSLNGTYLGKMNLDPISGAIVSNELKRIEDEFFEADCAEAKERLGRDPHADELARTPAQRRADAMVEMAVRSASAPADARRPEPLFTVVVDYPTLAGRVSQLHRARPSPRGRCCAGWTRPPSNVSSLARTSGPSARSHRGSSPVPPAGPSKCVICSVNTSSATSRPSGAR